MSPKVLGKADKGIWKNDSESMNRILPMVNCKTPIAHLFNLATLTMVFFNERVAVVSLEVVSQNSQRAVFGEGVQVGEEFLDTSVAFKNLRWNHIRLGCGYYQIGDVATPLLHAFNVNEDLQDLFAVSFSGHLQIAPSHSNKRFFQVIYILRHHMALMQFQISLNSI